MAQGQRTTTTLKMRSPRKWIEMIGRIQNPMTMVLVTGIVWWDYIGVRRDANINPNIKDYEEYQAMCRPFIDIISMYESVRMDYGVDVEDVRNELRALKYPEYKVQERTKQIAKFWEDKTC